MNETKTLIPRPSFQYKGSFVIQNFSATSEKTNQRELLREAYIPIKPAHFDLGCPKGGFGGSRSLAGL